MEKTGTKKGEFIKELLKDFLVAAVIVFLITLVIKPTIVKETSMLDTLQPNNYLILNKLAYVGDRSPQRGDIIVFESELENAETGRNMLLIKRVIGIEGDEISFRDNNVYRNGKLLKEDYVCKSDETPVTYPEASFTVGEDEVFVMGDHRQVSRDSRYSEVGMVSEDSITGKAVIRLYPFNEIGLL
ncbi:MAG: signal peptidase I [Lentihominibacter sp.]